MWASRPEPFSLSAPLGAIAGLALLPRWALKSPRRTERRERAFANLRSRAADRPRASLAGCPLRGAWIA
eukprot:10640811-Lingulodinium_polyedra.AAC.1